MERWLRLDRDYPRWVVEDQGAIIGHGQILVLGQGVDDLRDYYGGAFPGYSIDQLAIQQRLAVDPRRRRQGVAGDLVKALVEWSKSHGLLPAVVISQTQAASTDLYRAAGWAKVIDYWGLHNTEMTSFVYPGGLGRYLGDLSQ